MAKETNKYLIRTNRAGVFYGEIVSVDDNTRVAKLANVRRIWYWSGACSLSQMCMEGVKNPGSCKFSMTVTTMTVYEVIEILPCTEQACKSIESVKVWKN